jgi:DNA-directed RNA polymerase subunit beta
MPDPIKLKSPLADGLTPETGRELGNPDVLRQAIFDNVLEATQKFAPVVTPRYTLALTQPGYEGADRYTKDEEKRAILEGRTLGRRLRGTWQLLDTETGQKVDERRMTLATVPYLTPRGTFISNGSDIGMAHQMRLRPGIFTRRKESGELESHVNVARGHGHRYFLDPETGVFRIQLQQSKIPLITVLRSLGATDSQLRKAWGNELYSANATKDDQHALKKLYKKLQYGKTPESGEELNQGIRDAFEHMQLDPAVAEATLGKATDRVDVDTILATTQKLLAVQKGETDVDDRDAMAYQRTLGPEDILAERIGKATPAVRRMLWRAAMSGSLERAQPGVFEKSMRGAMLDTGLGSALEEINPAELYDQMMRVTRMGEGGIPSLDAVPDEARNVQPSHLGFIDPVHTPESGKIGVDTRLAINTRKGKDGTLYSEFIDAKTGKSTWKSPQDLTKATIAFPGELEQEQPFVKAIQDGRERIVPTEEVDYQLKTMTDTFGPLASMVPLKAAAFPQRVAMGSRYLTQALPVVNAEAPLVQSGVPGSDQSFEEQFGNRMGAVRSEVDGTVIDVSPTNIKVRDHNRRMHNIELYDNLPYNRKTFIHNTPTVEVGAKVRAGDMLAKSNFTDDQGSTALGQNVRVAYLPYKGWNYEDAIVVSESYAKRSASEHMYQNDLDLDDATKADRNAFISIFPGKLDRKQLQKYDDNGVIKRGETVNMDDPLILAVRERRAGPKIGRRSRAWGDASVKWDHHAPGVVTDVHVGKKGINVIVKSTQPTQVGDKFAGRYGDKGVVAAIIPDERMPQDGEGQPFEMLLNPLGIISRGNPSQLIEAALGKVAAKRGSPYKMTDFDTKEDLQRYALRELRANGLASTETVKDPENDRGIDDIATGIRYMLKLHHTAEAKLQGRATGGYSAEEAPAKGGEEGSKRIGMMELNALLSHGAYENVRDITTIRGQQNEDYWRQIMSGFTPPTPKVPHMYEKFVNSLKAAGINPLQQGHRINIMAMTNNDIEQMTENRRLKNVETVDWRVDRLTPKKGGLFDDALTGGHGGKQWSYIKLHEPLPNPVMEEPMRYLLGLTRKKFNAVLAGKETLREPEPGEKLPTGPEAIREALDAMDVDREIAKERATVKTGRKTQRDQAVRRLKYLQGAKRNKQHPREWFLDRAPVLPPAYRAVSKMQQTGTPLVADANFLYKELWDANELLQDMKNQVDDVTDERATLYKAFKSVTGLGDPVQPKNKEQKTRGILKQIFGTSPKYGMVQRKLLGSTVDLVGRGTITPNPNLDMDQVGLPEEKAWKLFQPFIIRRLVRRGMPRMRALEAVKDRSDVARKELVGEMQERPVILTRAPVLHRYGTMAFWPQLTRNKTLEIPPLITGGFNADFDGDAMQFNVPADQKAVEEAKRKLLPSRNLLSAAKFDVHYTPTHEYVGGLWEASRAKENTKPRIRNRRDAIAAYRRGDISVGQRIEIMD